MHGEQKMIENKAYIYIDNKYHKEAIELLKLIFKEKKEIIKENNLLKLIVNNCDGFSLILKNFLKNQLSEMISCSILIVPSFDKRFEKYIHYKKDNVSAIFDIFLDYLNDDIIKDAHEIVKEVGKKNIDTIEAFIDCNMNVLKTSELLYLHRNSLNYRLNQFSLKTGYDIRDINTIMFLKIVINISKNK